MPVKEQWQRTVAEIMAAGTPRGRARLGACALEGTRLFERALAAGATLECCVVTASFLRDPGARIAALCERLRASGCTPSVVPEDVMHELTAGRSIGAIVGLARMPAATSLAGVLASAPESDPLLLGCVGLDDPGNVGALVRTAHASGARALLSVGSTDAFHPRAVRTSMGSVFRLPVLQWPSFEDLLTDLRAAGVRTLAAVSRGGVPLPEVEERVGPRAALIGSEAFGLAPAARLGVDQRVTIPMPDGVDSFSVNAAAAVLLYALGRSRAAVRSGA